MLAQVAWRGPALTAVTALALAAPGQALAATATVDVVTVPGDEGRDVQARTWRADVEDGYAKRVTFDVPRALFDPAALAALLAAEGTVIGSVSAEISSGTDASSVGGGIAVAAGSCGARPRCVPLRIVDADDGRVLLAIRASTSDATGGGVVWIELTVRNLETESGSLFRARPDGRAFDTRVAVVTCSVPAEEGFDRCGPDGPTVRGSVREVGGGRSAVTLRALRSRTTYGGRVAFAGRVYRGGRPSAGEELVLEPYRRASGFDPSPGRSGTTRAVSGPDGSFRVAVPLGMSSRWAVKAAKPATAARPALATLAAATRKPVWVHAPRPQIEIIRARRVGGVRIRALVAVSNPLARTADAIATVVVGRRRIAKALARDAARSVFRVVGRTGVRVQAYVYEPSPSAALGFVSPRIAAGWSERLRLAPRPAG
jgi:hypothetical protein